MTVNSKECKDEITTCIRNIHHVLNDSRIAFSQDEHQLDLLCGHLNKTVSCVNEFITHCLGDDYQKQYTAMISGTLVLIDRLCTQTSHFRQNYLVHAKCYHELADDYKRCAQVYYENEQARVATVRENNYINLELRLWCCNYDGHRDCTKRAVRNKCGTEAAELAEQIVVISGGNIVHQHCANYTVDSDHCATVPSSSASHHHNAGVATISAIHENVFSLFLLRLPTSLFALTVVLLSTIMKFT